MAIVVKMAYFAANVTPMAASALPISESMVSSPGALKALCHPNPPCSTGRVRRWRPMARPSFRLFSADTELQFNEPAQK